MVVFDTLPIAMTEEIRASLLLAYHHEQKILQWKTNQATSHSTYPVSNCTIQYTIQEFGAIDENAD
jgi:hypothetical protein